MHINRILYKILGWSGLFLPLFVSAIHSSGHLGGDPGLLNLKIVVIQTTLRSVIGFFFVLATVIFLWGVIQYIRSSADDAGRKKAQGIITWGIIGLAVMTVAWGIVAILTTYLGVPADAPDRVPPPPEI